MGRFFKTPKGTELQLMDIKGKPYLNVQNRILWFREEKPLWAIETEFIFTNEKESFAKATIKDESGRIIVTAHKSETAQGFQDHKEKSESSAIGRALGFLGYGTQFALDLEEGDRLTDSPVEAKKHNLPNHASNIKPGNIPISDYTLKTGKTKGSQLKNCNPIDLENYSAWLKEKNDLKGSALEDLEAIEKYLAQDSILDSIPPQTNYKEEFPF